MGATSREDETEGEEQAVPKEVIDGIQDVTEGRLATKQDLAEVLKF